MKERHSSAESLGLAERGWAGERASEREQYYRNYGLFSQMPLESPGKLHFLHRKHIIREPNGAENGPTRSTVTRTTAFRAADTHWWGFWGQWQLQTKQDKTKQKQSRNTSSEALPVEQKRKKKKR